VFSSTNRIYNDSPFVSEVHFKPMVAAKTNTNQGVKPATLPICYHVTVIWFIYPIYTTFALEIDVRRERCRSLLLFYKMNTIAQIQALETKVNDLIAADTDLFLVEIRIKPTNNYKIYVDGDQGVSIEKLVQLNRKLYKQLEEENPNGDFSLEISSPGLDEPLKLHRQYIKNIGRFVEVLENEGVKKEGKLLSATENEIIVEEIKGKGKKQETIQHCIPLSNIKTTTIQIKF
jgi:ribosome maturation factor RimP